MILWRVLPWDASAAETEPGGPLWFPRGLQGSGRHDNPDRYACLYASERPVSTVAEALAVYRGAGSLRPEMLVRAGRPLALAALGLAGEAELIDLDEPQTLVDEALRPSTVATRNRALTQPQAARLHEDHAGAAGLRWWSTLESEWINVTLFDRSAPQLQVERVEALALGHTAVREAAEALGLA